MKTLATALLVLLSLLVAENSIAQQSINSPPDTIFYNGKIITVDSGFTIAQAFAVRGDLYVAVGTDAAIRALAGANTRLVDLRGFAVIPGLSDNHDHLYNSEKVMRGIDLVGATSTAEVLRRLPEQYKALMLELNRLGWRHSPHVATNEALEAVLQAYEAADRESPIRDKRWVVEHIPNVTPPLMDRLAKLGVIVSTNMAGYAGNYDAAVRALGQEGPNPETATSNNPFVPLYYTASRAD
jgi:predicted amidohydrolase YtcJ